MSEHKTRTRQPRLETTSAQRAADVVARRQALWADTPQPTKPISRQLRRYRERVGGRRDRFGGV